MAGYIDQGGRSIVQNAPVTGTLDTFVLPDAMVGQPIVDALGKALATFFGQIPGTDSEGRARFEALAQEVGFDAGVSFTGEAYDAAVLILLAMQAANSTATPDRTAKVVNIATAPASHPARRPRPCARARRGRNGHRRRGRHRRRADRTGRVGGQLREVEFKNGTVETFRFR